MKNLKNAIRLMYPLIAILLGVFGMTGALSIVQGKMSDAIGIFVSAGILLILGFVISLCIVSSVESKAKELSDSSE